MVEYILRQGDVCKIVACLGKLRTDHWMVPARGHDSHQREARLPEKSDGAPVHPFYLPYGLLPWNCEAAAPIFR